MSYPAYPLDKCPYPVRDSFSNQYGHPFSRTEMDDSHGRIRRRFAMQPVNYSLTWHMSFDQFKWFEAFLKYDCAQASGYFTMPLNPTSSPLTMRFTAYPDAAFDTSSGAWVVSGTVEWVRAAPTGSLGATLPTFPAALPLPEQSNYSIKRAGTVSRSNLTDGLASQRARFQDEVALVQMQWELNPTEYAIFDSFIHDSLLGGLAPFTGPFANGLGLQNVRVNFIAPPTTTSNGSCYTLTAQAEVRNIPVISEITYRGWDKITLSDSITYNATMIAQLGTQSRDTFGYADQVKFKIGKRPTDTVSYSDSLTVKINAIRVLTENLVFTEQLAWYIAKRDTLDYLVLRTDGKICFEDYATDYVVFGYDAKCNAFSAEEALSDAYTFNETISIHGSFSRAATESVSYTTSGGIVGNQYCAPDYVAFGYTADSLATFTN